MTDERGEAERWPRGEGSIWNNPATELTFTACIKAQVRQAVLRPQQSVLGNGHVLTDKTARPNLDRRIFPSDFLGGGLFLPVSPARRQVFLRHSSYIRSPPFIRNGAGTRMPAAKREAPQSPDFFSRTLGAPRSVFSKFSPQVPYLPSAVSLGTSGHQAVHHLHCKLRISLSVEAQPC